MSGLKAYLAQQTALFEARHPKSKARFESGNQWFDGVPMHWMRDWAGPFPIVADQAKGARLSDIDGLEYDDFCLGDTPSMFGHGREDLAQTIAEQASLGLGTMLPSLMADQVSEALVSRFGLPYWQMTTSATDANRAALKWARQVTQRQKILIFDGCYHGMVDDCQMVLKGGVIRPKDGLIGFVHDHSQTTVVIDFNDVAALKAALSGHDIACVLCEPVMTNCGMILPIDGFHEALRDLCTQTGTLLIIDETHSLSSGPSGYCGAHGLRPDILTIGKAIAGGYPCAVFGVTDDLSQRMIKARDALPPGASGIGTTLSGNAMAIAILKTMLTQVMTDETYETMLKGAAYLAQRLRDFIDREGLGWSVVATGARLELLFTSEPIHTAQSMRAMIDPVMMQAFHLSLLNAGHMIAPFHNMILISPFTTQDAIDRLMVAIAQFAADIKEFR